MKNPLIKYVRTELDKGFSEDSIKRVLLQDGYTEKQVNHAFMIIGLKRMTAIAVVIIILMLMVFAWMMLYKNNNSSASEENNNAVHQNTNSEIPHPQGEAASAESAISSNDLNACSNAGKLEGYCKAVVSGDASMCKDASSDLREACIVRIARKNKDSTLCAGLSSLRGNCYLQLALLTKNKALCGNSGNNKEYCVSQLQ